MEGASALRIFMKPWEALISEVYEIYFSEHCAEDSKFGEEKLTCSRTFCEL